MDIKNYFIEKLSLFNEDYLIALGNKGLYKRASKELEKNPDPVYEVKDDCIEFEIEGNKVSIGEENKCTCISRSTCKHIILAYLYLKSNSQSILGIGEGEVEEVRANFDYLLEFDYAKLSKALLNRYKKALRRIELNFPYSVTEGNVIEVQFDTNKIRFFPDKEAIEAVCTCKSRDMCSHKIEAIAYYRNYKGMKDSIEELIEFSREELADFSHGTLDTEETVDNLLNIGLVRYKDMYLLEQLGIKLRSYNMPNFEKRVRVLIRELNKFIKKSSNFSLERVKKEVIGLKTDSLYLRKAISDREYKKVEELAGKFRSEYMEIPPTTLHSLGYEKWQSPKGKGETIYFYSKEGIYTYNWFANTAYASKEVNWSGGVSFDLLKKGSFEIKNGKADMNRRLSSAKDTSIKPVKESNLEAILKDFSAESWNNVLKKVLDNRDDNVFLIGIKEILQGDFDEIRQEKNIRILDRSDNIIEANLKFSNKENQYIANIEKAEKTGDKYEYLLGKIFIEKGKIYLYPLVLYNNRERLVLRS